MKSIKRKRRILIMKKWVCTVCGYVYEGENAPEKCPQCGVPASKFKEQESDKMKLGHVSTRFRRCTGFPWKIS